MTSTERSTLINDIVAHAPAGLGLAGQTRANLEAMSDEDLGALHAKLQLVAEHVAKSPLKRPADLAAKRAALAASRAERYGRLAKLGKKAQPSATPILKEVIGGKAARLLAIGAKAALDAVEPHSAVRVWNSFDRESVRPVEHMRHVIRSWLGEFATKVIGKPEIQGQIWAMLDGPLRVEFDNYIQIACDRIGRDSLRLVRNNLVHGGLLLDDLDLPMPIGVLDGLIRATVETEFAPISGRIRETNAIDGLARMRAFALHYQPDVILSVSSGGKIVGDFIAMEAKMGAPQAHLVTYRGKHASVPGGWKALRSCQRILLVDDIAIDTDLLCSAHRSLQDQLVGTDIQMVALASSFETRDALIHEGHANVFVAHLAGGEVDVPWDRTGTYEINSRNHVFGVGREDALRIARGQLKRVSQSLEAPIAGTEQSV